ncbi:MAG: TonB-dependent receptor [Brumimicrobium sp.]|nr:TonB-dependent receptor [Brumimicrobium sp.]
MSFKGIHISLDKLFIMFLYGVCMPFFAFGQSDTTVFEEITIKGHHPRFEQQTILKQQDIQKLVPSDLGTALQYINGISIKNYGDIGGLKTLSYRGLGGEHTQLIIDGEPISDPQSGQINYATIPPNNIEEIKLYEQNNSELLPVSALVKSNVVLVKTFDQQFGTHPFALRTNFLLGSFGQKEADIRLKNTGKNYFISTSGAYKAYKGDYTYRLPFGNQDTSYRRQNNELTDFHINLGGGYKWRKQENKHVLTTNLSTHTIQQELPGAVILYNNLTQATMSTQSSLASLHYNWYSKNSTLKGFAQYAHRYLRYYDPNFLNSVGFLENKYTTQSVSGGFHYQYHWKDLYFNIGDDFSYDILTSNRDIGSPSRYTNTAMLRVKYEMKYFFAEANGFLQSFIDNNTLFSHQKSYHRFNPTIAIYTSEQLVKKIQFYAWFKPSSRAPSFTDLYYSQIGNKDLDPEEATQFNAGINSGFTQKGFSLTIQTNFFKNWVRNKILALPTKNLFIWSIQNVGKVDVIGGDINLNLKYEYKNWRTSLQLGFNYQQVEDISDKNSPTYRHQIAYTPKITGNTLFSISFKGIFLSYAGLYIGERYSLNENIPSNHLDAYFTSDLSLGYQLKLAEKHTIELQAGIKNLTDIPYNYIRYFVMPGRNYFIKLSYAFN